MLKNNGETQSSKHDEPLRYGDQYFSDESPLEAHQIVQMTDKELYDEWKRLNHFSHCECERCVHAKEYIREKCKHSCKWTHGGKCCYCKAVHPELPFRKQSK